MSRVVLGRRRSVCRSIQEKGHQHWRWILDAESSCVGERGFARTILEPCMSIGRRWQKWAAAFHSVQPKESRFGTRPTTGPDTGISGSRPTHSYSGRRLYWEKIVVASLPCSKRRTLDRRSGTPQSRSKYKCRRHTTTTPTAVARCRLPTVKQSDVDSGVAVSQGVVVCRLKSRVTLIAALLSVRGQNTSHKW